MKEAAAEISMNFLALGEKKPKTTNTVAIGTLTRTRKFSRGALHNRQVSTVLQHFNWSKNKLFQCIIFCVQDEPPWIQLALRTKQI